MMHHAHPALQSEMPEGEGLRNVSKSAHVMGIERDVVVTREVWDRWIQQDNDHAHSIVKERLDTLLRQIKQHLPGIVEGNEQSEYLCLHFPNEDRIPSCAMNIQARCLRNHMGTRYIEVNDTRHANAKKTKIPSHQAEQDAPDPTHEFQSTNSHTTSQENEHTDTKLEELAHEVLGLRAELEEARRCPHRVRLPDVRQSVTHKFSVDGHEGYIIVGLFDDGRPGELFLKMAKQGSTLSGLLDTVGVLASLCLQYGVPVEALARKFEYMRFEPSGWTKNEDIRQAHSIVDYIFRWFGQSFSDEYRQSNKNAEAASLDFKQASG